MSVIPHGGTWVADTHGDDAPTYLMSIVRDGQHYGWKVGKLSAVLDLLSDQDYAVAIGEEADTVEVFVLTEVAPIPVVIESTAHASIGKIERRVMWRDPGLRGRGPRARKSETGFTNIIDV